MTSSTFGSRMGVDAAYLRRFRGSVCSGMVGKLRTSWAFSTSVSLSGGRVRSFNRRVGLARIARRGKRPPWDAEPLIGGKTWRAVLLTVVRARLPRPWIMMVAVALCVGAMDGCGSQSSAATRSQAPTSARAVTARTYGAQVSAVCKRYNAEIAQIGREAHGSREHEVQLARATNATTASEARALMQIPRPSGFDRIERLYRAILSAANVADESTRLFLAGQLGRANAASVSASHDLSSVNGAFRRLGLSICAE